MGYNTAADGETWRMVSDNSVINPNNPTDPFPKNEWISTGYPVASAGFEFIFYYRLTKHIKQKKKKV